MTKSEIKARVAELRRITDTGRTATAFLSYDEGNGQEDRDAKVFAVDAAGYLDCKEFSGSEFTVHVSELIEVGQVAAY
jgi:hypothetical protein